MKKVILVAASLCLFAFAASAQEEKREVAPDVVVPVSESQVEGAVPTQNQQLNTNQSATNDPANAAQFEPKKEEEAKPADSVDANKTEE